MNRVIADACKAFVRDLRSGDLRILMVAVALAVAALCAVGFFAGRLEAALKRDAAQLLGADAVIASDQPAPDGFARTARDRGLQTARTASFPSMALSDAQARLVALKAVSDGYPLRGSVTLVPSDDRRRPAEPARGVPPPGEAWVDGAVLAALNIPLGGELRLGNARFRATREIAIESDRGAGFMNFAPRVMIGERDLAATGLVQPASRITYRLLIAGDPQPVRDYVRWAEQQIEQRGLRGIRVESLESGRPEMVRTLDRAEGFLRLVALLAAMLAAVAVAIGARRFAQRKVDACALMRVMGAPQRQIAATFIGEFALAGVIAAAIGTALGFAAHYAFAALLAGLVEGRLPPVDWRFAGLGMAAGLTLLAAFGLPPVLNLARVPALRVIRRDIGPMQPGAWLVGAVSLAGFAALLLLIAKDARLGGISAAGFLAAWLLFMAAGWGASRFARVWSSNRRLGAALSLAARQLASRPVQTGVQVAALGIGLLALSLLYLMRTDLVDGWRQATPPDAPNRFVINVQPDQAEAFRAALAREGIVRYDWYPMVRGRLVAIDDQPVTAERFSDERAKRLVDREFNLSSGERLPEHNRLVAGRWYRGDRPEISIEEGIAQTLGLKLGDTLRFDMAGQTVDAPITSLRKVDWGSMRVNFFVLMPPSALRDAPLSYISAFRAGEGDDAARARAVDNALTREFPNITIVDVSASIAQVQAVLDQVIRAVEFLFLFAVATGLVVLIAALRASEAERARYVAILRALGGARAMLSRSLAAELLLVGTLAGLLAALAAAAVGWALARYVFEFDWRITPWLPLAGALAGAALAWGAGWWQLRRVVHTPVNASLREAP
jgi:putative ABC transport system permease protein